MEFKKIMKQKKGIVVTDAIVAILLILLFAGIITSLMTNIFFESAKIKSGSQQIDFTTELFEHVDKLSYEEVTLANLIKYVNEDKNNEHVKAGTTIDEVKQNFPEAQYKIAITVENYMPTDEEIPKLDLVKKVTVTIENNLGNNPYCTTMSRVKKASMDDVQKILKQEKL